MSIGKSAASRKCRFVQCFISIKPHFGSSISKISRGVGQVSGSLSWNFSPCFLGLPLLASVAGGAVHKQRLGRKRMILSAGMSAVNLRKGAHPYSLSHKLRGRLGRWWQTCLNWKAAFIIGLWWLVVLSWRQGNAQLPSSSGIQAMVLYPCPKVIGLPLITFAPCSKVRSFRVSAYNLG